MAPHRDSPFVLVLVNPHVRVSPWVWTRSSLEQWSSREKGTSRENALPMNLADELQKLQKLRESGALNDEEFSLAKAKLLNESPASAPAKPSFFASTSGDATALEQETRRWAFLLHLS